MKKLLPLLLLPAFVVLFTASCKKKYTCTCTYTDLNGQTQTDASLYTGTKTDAKNACTSRAVDYTNLGTNISCSL